MHIEHYAKHMYGNLVKKGTFLAQDIQDALPGSQKIQRRDSQSSRVCCLSSFKSGSSTTGTQSITAARHISQSKPGQRKEQIWKASVLHAIMFQQILAGIHADLITISCYRLQLNTICISFPQKE